MINTIPQFSALRNNPSMKSCHRIWTRKYLLASYFAPQDSEAFSQFLHTIGDMKA